MTENKEQNVNNLTTSDVSEEKTFTFYNAGLGRRILAYLADIFLSFILCVFVLEIIYFPIVKHCTNYEDSVYQLKSLGESRYSLYYENDILFYEDSETLYDFDLDFEYTGDIFTKFYVFKESSNEDLIVDPIVHYYTETAIESSRRSYFEVAMMYYGDDGDNEYFLPYNAEISNYLVLKDIYKERWAPYFDVNDQVSDEILAEIKTFKSLVFRNNALTIMSDFAKNNAVYEVYTNQINTIQTNFDFMYQMTTLGAFLTVFIALFVVTPLVDKKGRTLGKIFLKLETVNSQTFKYLTKKSRTAVIFLTLLEQLPIVLFIPFITVGITEIFTLSISFILTLVSAAYVLIDLVIALTNKLNYSVKELLTQSVVVEKALMDQYYREVVYGEKARTTSK